MLTVWAGISTEASQPTPTPEASPSASDKAAADGLTADQSKWRLLRAEAWLYADKQAYEDANRYRTERRKPALLKMACEDRAFKIAVPKKVELLQASGPNGTCKVRFFHRVRGRTLDMWTAESDVLPYDADVEKKANSESEQLAQAMKAVYD